MPPWKQGAFARCYSRIRGEIWRSWKVCRALHFNHRIFSIYNAPSIINPMSRPLIKENCIPGISHTLAVSASSLAKLSTSTQRRHRFNVRNECGAHWCNQDCPNAWCHGRSNLSQRTIFSGLVVWFNFPITLICHHPSLPTQRAKCNRPRAKHLVVKVAESFSTTSTRTTNTLLARVSTLRTLP